MTTHSFRTAGVILGASAMGFLAGGCPPADTPSDQPTTKPVLERFASGDELLSFVNQQALAQTNRSAGLFGGVMNLAPTAAEAGSADTAAGGDQSNGTTSYTTTNLQEEGVDESDVFKSDGVHFFIGKGKTLRIVSALPMTDMAEVARVELDQYIDSLYLVGSKVIVLGQQLAYYYGGGLREPQMDLMMWPPYYADSTVTVTEIDISDPATPTIVHQTDLDGALATSRLTNQRLIVVLTITPPLPDNPNFFNMLGVTVDDVLPKMRTLSGGESAMVTPEDWFHPDSPNGYFTTAVVTLDAGNIETVVGSVAVMANAGTIYASTEALYLTDTDYTVDNNYRETTAIHKLAFNADGVAEYVASGSVPGRLLSQFSLGEYNGYLRVATHISDYSFGGGDVIATGVGASDDSSSPPATGSDGSDAREQDQDPADDATAPDDTVTVEPVQNSEKNAVYVLGENAGTLEVVGKIEDIAPGEQLYAARFMGARGFLVTFVQIDPLFVLDLADPTNPQIAGELELPGYSDYLHPFGENLLIGVGRSSQQSPWGGVITDALQLSLFDVSDLANPTLVEQLEVGGYGSSSDVSYTHKAFTFLPDRGLLAIPAQLMSEQNDPFGQWYGYNPDFDGILCFHVDATEGFVELGRVSSVVYEELGWTQWRRAAIIDDGLFAVTPAGVRAVDLADFNTPEKLVLTPNDDEIGGNTGEGESSPGSPGGTDSGATEPAATD